MKNFHRWIKILVAVFLLLSIKANACNCTQPNLLTIAECVKFDVILQCKIDSVMSCSGKSIANATVVEIYKGEKMNSIQLLFDCSSSCQMSFAKNEQWLIYGKWNDQKQLQVFFCDRNRKYFSKASDDYFAVNARVSFQDEIKFLKKNIGFKSAEVSSNNNSIDITGRENFQTSGSNKLLLLFGSLVLFLVIYFVFNKMIK